MRKLKFLILAFAVSLSSCASTDTLNSNRPASYAQPSLDNHSDYIAAAIADWIREEANSDGFDSVILAKNNSQFDKAGISEKIESRLKSYGIKVANDEAPTNLKAWYWVGEFNDQILIRIRANEREATRLFAKAKDDSITPASPLTIRATP